MNSDVMNVNFVSPFQGFDGLWRVIPERCPGLSCVALSARQIGGLKGRDRIAQGNALGHGCNERFEP